MRLPALTALTVTTALAATLLTPATAPAAAAAAPPDAPVTYVHDANGRLTTVLDPAGRLARYEYDAAGNILSISRATAPARGLVEVSPKVVSPGGTLTVVGRGFGATAADNVVRIGGKVATVTGVSPTQLVVSVPADATSGAVTVTTPAGVVSGADVTVEASRKPTVTKVPAAPVGPGQSITVNGTGFATGSLETWVAINNTRAVVTAVTATSVTATVPEYVTSGKVTVGTPYGRASSAKDLSVAPAPIAPADVAQIVRGSVGQLRTVAVPTAGKVGLQLFEGKAGQRVTLTMTGNTFGYAHFSLLRPDGVPVVDRQGFSSGNRFIDTVELVDDGTYTVVVDPDAQSTGKVDLRVRDVAPDLGGPIAVGAPATRLRFATPGQNGAFTFSGTAGERVAISVATTTLNDYLDFSLLGPDGTQLYGSFVNKKSRRWTDAIALPDTGTYTLVVDPESQGVGNATVSLAAVPDDTAGTIRADGPVRTVTTAAPGQNALLTFAGTAGDKVALTVRGTTVTDAVDFLVRAPDGSQVYGSFVNKGGRRWSDAKTLPLTGTYTIEIDPVEEATGKSTYELAKVPADSTGTLTIDGPEVSVANAKPGQNGSLAVSGTAGQQVIISATSTTSTGFVDFTLLTPSGDTLYTSWVAAGSTRTSPTRTLPVDGTYQLVIDPEEESTGSVTYVIRTASGAPSGAATTDTGPRPGAEPVEETRPAPSGDDDYRPALGWWQPEQHPRPARFATSNGADALEATPWEGLPALQAPPGETALAGQVLSVDGLPLAGVTLSFGTATTTSDETGRFLLRRVQAGKSQLYIDGSTADTADVSWGFYEVFVDAVPGRTSVLTWTTWLSPLDIASGVQLPASGPTTEDLVVTTEDVPGLEFRLPKGTTVQERTGEQATQVSMTAIPVERPPFPLPQLGVQVPVYFTLQPGSADVLPDGGQIIYPNYSNEPAGKRVEFWNYDPDEGWEVYGFGHVSPDGKQVLPDPGTRITELTGAMFNAGNSPPPTGRKPRNADGGDPVDLATGLFVQEALDLDLPATVPLSVDRTYLSGDTVSRTFGIGSSLTYDMFLWSAHQYTEVDLVLPDGDKVHMERTSPGTGFRDAVFDGGPRADEWTDVHMAWDEDVFGWVLSRPSDGAEYLFEAYVPLGTIRDRSGNEVRLHRDSSKKLTEATTSDGRWVRFTYDDSKRVTQVLDDAGRTVDYAYDSKGRLETVTDSLDRTTTYGYDAGHRMTSIEDARGVTVVANTYDSAGRVADQEIGNGGHYLFGYTTSGDRITRTDLTDPEGHKRRVTFDANGHVTSDTVGFGTAQAQTTTLQPDADGLLLAEVDPLGRRTELGYDDETGLPTSVTVLAGTPRAATWSVTYDAEDRLRTSTDPLDRTTTYSYAANGSLASAEDPTGAVTAIATDRRGRPLAVTNPTGGTTELGWSLGDPVSTTDPLGRSTSYAVDAVGLTHGMTDPLGAVWQRRYDAAGQLVRTVDALGGEVEYAYDEVGHPTSLTDERDGVTRFSWDEIGNRRDMTDPLGKTDSVTYDLNGNPVRRTRRTGAVSRYTWDVLDRLTKQVYGAQTVTRSYDKGDRLLTVTGGGGDISRSYDPYGVASETRAGSTVAYTYDDLGRRSTMRVTPTGGAAQPELSYGYDKADRVLTLDRGTDVATHTYDADGQRTSTTLPNGVRATRTYDAAGQLTRIAYTKGAAQVGDLTYSYDAAGRTASVGGSLARVDLPAAVSGATYDAANRPTSWAGRTVTHDADGNLTSDGTRTFGYDARDRLTSVSGPDGATYSYDDLGRRTSRTVGGVTTTTVYDGTEPTLETVGTEVVPLFGGPDAGEVYGRLAPSGKQWLLADALGSTVAVTGTAGTVRGSYTYQPFGASTATGVVGTNSFRFTNRETDATGLSYHGARYLAPSLGRWLNEDPIGFAAGSTNLASYVHDDPVDWIDLDGRDPKGPPPEECGFWCSVLDKVLKKAGGDYASKKFPDGSLPELKDAWKPGPRKEYEDQVKQYGEDAKNNSNTFRNPLRNLWDGANDALGGDAAP